jgi:uncharacterized protein YeaO (DUF488 family)
MALYTAQYRYSGQDRLDITAKGKDTYGNLYAPTWEMVMGYKKGRLTKSQYTDRYYDLLRYRWRHEAGFSQAMSNLAEAAKRRDVTLVCFCQAGDFCHRNILKDILVKSFNVPYVGERSL